MYVYIKVRDGGHWLYTVGYYSPEDYEWTPESDWPNREDAARRVSWLNGGTGEPFTI